MRNVSQKDLIMFVKSQSCKVLSTEAADTARHVHPLCNIKHVNISIDAIIYVAGTTHMLKISVCSSALQIWNQNTHPYPGSSPVILQTVMDTTTFVLPLCIT